MSKNGVGSWKRLETNRKVVPDSDEVHVLAVDDSFVDRKVIERLLKISSCKVTVVDSGLRALQFLGLDEEQSQSQSGFDGLKVDLIITDYCMPGMTGYELLKKLKESSTFRQIPVVIMSSENVLPRIDMCLEEGAEDFIVKPVKLSDVKRIKDFMIKDHILKSSSRKRKLSSDDDSLVLSTSPPSILSMSAAPCSPPSLDSPTRRMKMTGLD
ncbi:hypothetical protein ACFE04_024744 [Oxalis oulophora]